MNQRLFTAAIVCIITAGTISIYALKQVWAQTTSSTPADTTPPVISAIYASTNLGVTIVTWTTDKPADSYVEHGSTASYGSVNQSTSLVIAHSVTLNVGLGYGTPYYYRIKSKDSSGNLATSGPQTLLIPLPDIPCTDSDNGINTSQKGTGTGIYAGAVVGYHKIYGQEPNPATPKDTPNNYSTFIDHCATATQLNEAFCQSGKISAIGLTCANGCANGICLASATDAPPSITVSVKSANELHPNDIYAGLRAYIAISITDDKGINSASFDAPGMKYSSATVNLTQCASGIKTCSEPVYIIVPSKAGAYTVTVKATDSGNQTATKSVTFTALGCTANSECGGTYFPSSGATFCGPSNASLYTERMKYQVVSICSAGVCDEKTEPGVLENCAASNKICGFSPLNGGQFQCVTAPTLACAYNTSITTSCMCGPSSYESYGYCCLDSAQKPYHSSSTCPPATPTISPTPMPAAASTTSSTPTSNTSSSSSSASQTFSTPSAAQQNINQLLAAPSSLPETPANQQQTTSTVPAAPPGATSSSQQAQNATSSAAIAPIQAQAIQQLTPRQTKEIGRQKTQIMRELRTIEKFYKRVKINEKIQAEIASLRDTITNFKPVDNLAYGKLAEIQESLSDLQADYKIDAENERLLKLLKQSVGGFEKFILALSAKTASIERKKIPVRAAIKDAIAAARSLAQEIKKTTDFRAAEILQDKIDNTIFEFNEIVPELEQLSKTPDIILIINQQISNGERILKAATSAIQQLQIDGGAYREQMSALLDEMQNGSAAIKASSVDFQDVPGFIQEHITQKLDELQDLASEIQAAARATKYIKTTKTKIMQFKQRIKLITKKTGDAMTEVEALVGELEVQQKNLQRLTAEQLSVEVAEQIILLVRSMEDTREQLEDALNLTVPDGLEKRLNDILTRSRQAQSFQFQISR